LDHDEARSAPLRDSQREAALRRTGLIDGPPDPLMARLAGLIGTVAGAPMSMICLADGDRQFLVAERGVPAAFAGARSLPASHSFCRHVVSTRLPVVVEDARLHPLLSDSPGVLELGIVAYAGVPLVSGQGVVLGTVCAMDRLPRRWTEAQLAGLADLAALAAAELHHRERPPASAATPGPRLEYDDIPVMVWTSGPDGQCDSFNARWLEFTGRTLEEELGAGWTDRVHPDDRELCLRRYRVALEEPAPLRLEYRCRRFDGQYRWLLDIAAPRFDADGALLGYVGCWTDVTDRRQLEQRLVRAERAEAIGQLAGGIAHDFNNLLTSIIGHVAMLREDPALTAHDDLAQIQRSADRAASLTRQLLAFSRRQVLVPRVVDLDRLVRGTLPALRQLVGSGIRITGPARGTHDPIMADPTQLEQVLTQLCGYARQTMPAGGVIDIEIREVALGPADAPRLSGARPGAYVALQVRDNGSGMDPSSLARVFEPFFGADPASQGTGLGLASVYGIVKQSGGHIEVASEPGRGTTFTIYFRRHEGSGPVGAEAGEPPGGDETILLVEDEEQVRDLARRVLERVGYTVLAAADAEAATAIADRHPGHIHLLLADMRLPYLNGRELAARLGIHRPAIKVLYISGTSDGSISRHRMLEPGTDFLEKPFSLDRLLRKVRQVLGEPVAAGRFT
jgi:PAS domain S-box-containing protein